VHITLIHVWQIRAAEGHTVRLLGIVQHTTMMKTVIHKIFGAVDWPQGYQQVLARMRIHHRGPIEDDIAPVGAILALEARATVLYLLVAEVQPRRGQPADDVTAVQVAVAEEEAGLLGRAVGEVATALHGLAELLADGVGEGPVGQVGEEVQLFVCVGVAEAGREVRAFSGQIPVAVACRGNRGQKKGSCQDPDHLAYFWC
jgi:hypothetical protein